MRKTRIIFVVPRFSVGGAEKLLVHSLRALDREVYEPTLVTIFAEQKDSCADQVSIDRCFHFRSTWDIPAFFRLYVFIRREKFDVVVTHLFVANLLARMAAIFAGIPIIVSYEHNIYPNKKRWQIFIDRMLAKRTSKIIADSEAAKIFTAKQESIPFEKFETIYIPPLFDERPRRPAGELRKELGISADALVVLCVSRLVIDKGHRHLIEAAPGILAKHPQAYILIGGWGPLKESLEAKVVALGVSERVRLLGRVDGQELLALADVYVDPSISTDLPVGIMEAMREKKAIVATSVGDIPTFIKDGETGRLVPPADDKALSEAIVQLLGDPKLRARLGEAAGESVRDFSLPAYMNKFDSLIRELRTT
ncbi:glycosyltransferase [Candidatus Kaiserbacteria bacterium]|nr:glycosyltransferase [Candidatus Kaiserbacteria bacterium]